LLEERQEFEPEEDTLSTRLITRLEALIDETWPPDVLVGDPATKSE
jgi:hypothetical protein